jgi:hypothetical protein
MWRVLLTKRCGLCVVSSNCVDWGLCWLTVDGSASGTINSRWSHPLRGEMQAAGRSIVISVQAHSSIIWLVVRIMFNLYTLPFCAISNVSVLV